MIDLNPVSKQAAFWPLKELSDEVAKLQMLLLSMHEKITELESEVVRLEQSKADRKGRKKSGISQN